MKTKPAFLIFAGLFALAGGCSHVGDYVWVDAVPESVVASETESRRSFPFTSTDEAERERGGQAAGVAAVEAAQREAGTGGGLLGIRARPAFRAASRSV